MTEKFFVMGMGKLPGVTLGGFKIGNRAETQPAPWGGNCPGRAAHAVLACITGNEGVVHAVVFRTQNLGDPCGYKALAPNN